MCESCGGIRRRHDLLGRGVRVVLPAHETAGLSRHASFSGTLLGMVGARPNVTAYSLSWRPHLLRSIAWGLERRSRRLGTIRSEALVFRVLRPRQRIGE